MSQELRQTPEPASFTLRRRGDVLSFRLALPEARPGRAWLRTNLGRAAVRRREIRERVEKARPALARDWHDVRMVRVGPAEWALRLPLLEVGCFEAKAFFLPRGESEPVWPEGPNAAIKVQPALTCCAGTLYAAFVRQFRGEEQAAGEADARLIAGLEDRGYAVIPPSGTFRELARRLDHVIGRMGFRILQLLPIHPTPTTFARMGSFGSPFAAIDFFDVDPSLAEFDQRTTPMQQFEELVDAVHRRGARLFLDIPVNHTGWASKLQGQHPEWFAREEGDRFRSPGAWGVIWGDLAELDYGSRRLWEYVAEVFLFWCARGVDGFRCDAGYMVPERVWEYATARVREQFPDTVFLLEGLGGSVPLTERLLARAGLDWAYSELFQQYDRAMVEGYLPGALATSTGMGTLVHFAETHDNDRLASRSRAWARMRTALAALLSDAGAFGITAGVEWFAEEKIDVHGAPSLAWGRQPDQVEAVARLTALLEEHPAFHAGARLELLPTRSDRAVALSREPEAGGQACLILANLDADEPARIAWPADRFPAAGAVDLLTDRAVRVEVEGPRCSATLAAGEILCLGREGARRDPGRERPEVPEGQERQGLQALALDLHAARHGLRDLGSADPRDLARRLAASPRGFMAELFGHPPPVVGWSWPRDLRRHVPVPPGHHLLIDCPHRFRYRRILEGSVRGCGESLRAADGTHFAILPPLPRSRVRAQASLHLAVVEPEDTRRGDGTLVQLGEGRAARCRREFSREAVIHRHLAALCTNGRGAMAQVRGEWGTLRSQYDAFLAANLHPTAPVDRRVLLTRCRAWLVHRGYSQELDGRSLQAFGTVADGVEWRFELPSGLGRLVPLRVRLELAQGRNLARIRFTRERARGPHRLDDASPVRLVLRPDVEDRDFHAVTRALEGPEEAWPAAVAPRGDGFRFAPSSGHSLDVHLPGGRFAFEPQWCYGVPHPFEAERGLAEAGDLFSPGPLSIELAGGASAELVAAATRRGESAGPLPPAREPPPETSTTRPLLEGLERAIGQFVVRRGDSRTMIAGFPWFLDWGRDALICVRGLVAAGRVEESLAIIRQFAAHEQGGTLPNMLAGDDDGNRDTSDAPLWLLIACRDLLAAVGDRGLLQTDCGGRRLREVLPAVAEGYLAGTPNGIRVDPESGLVFSPPHFTWMDTNHPAGTPRQGYPIEIQALWWAGLRFLAEVDPDGARWSSLADRVAGSIRELFVAPGQAWLVDCRHARSERSAAEAEPDDACRPNQLLALTLGAIGDPEIARGVLLSCEPLLVPGAIRSLADRPVAFPIPVEREGELLNDPHHPYQGCYRGDEDRRRKPAYHNGTAWTWLLPSYAEALVGTFGEGARGPALALLGGAVELMDSGCIGQVPEIADGDAPHEARGCGAQAWGATELYRVLRTLLGVGGEGPAIRPSSPKMPDRA